MNNTNGPSYHPTRFGNFLVWILFKLRDFRIGFVLWLECSESIGKSLAVRIFINQQYIDNAEIKSLNIGVVISMDHYHFSKKNSVAIATFLEEFNFLVPNSQWVYTDMI